MQAVLGGVVTHRLRSNHVNDSTDLDPVRHLFIFILPTREDLLFASVLAAMPIGAINFAPSWRDAVSPAKPPKALWPLPNASSSSAPSLPPKWISSRPSSALRYGRCPRDTDRKRLQHAVRTCRP